MAALGKPGLEATLFIFLPLPVSIQGQGSKEESEETSRQNEGQLCGAINPRDDGSQEKDSPHLQGPRALKHSRDEPVHDPSANEGADDKSEDVLQIPPPIAFCHSNWLPQLAKVSACSWQSFDSFSGPHH